VPDASSFFSRWVYKEIRTTIETRLETFYMCPLLFANLSTICPAFPSFTGR
jgi:hypothetical protein